MAFGLVIVPNFMPALDPNGNPMPGALLYVYVNETTIPATIPATVYTDPALTIPHENPIVANNAGEFPLIYAEAGSVYTLTLTTRTGARPITYDDVTAGIAVSPSGPVITPQMYGAVADGVTDTYAAVQAMFDAVEAAGGGRVWFPNGEYFTSQGWAVPSLVSVDLDQAVIIPKRFSQFVPYPTPDGGDLYFVFRNKNWDVYELTDHDITFTGGIFRPQLDNGATYWNGHAIDLRQVERASFARVRIFDMADGIAGVGVKDCLVFDCYAKNAANCSFDFWMGFQNVMVVNCNDEDSQTLVNGNSVLWLSTDTYTSSGLLVTGCTSKRCTNAAIFIDPLGNNSFVRDVKIVNNTFIGSGSGTATPITVHAASDVIIIGNTISNFTSAYLIQIGRSVYNAVTSESRQCTVSNNVFYDSATTGVYIFATGPHLTVEGNIARNCTTVIAVAFSDPTSYCGPNDLDGWSIAYIANSDPATGDPTTPAMQMDVDRTARKFNYSQPVKSTFFESSYVTGLTATGTNAATALVLTKALNFVQTTPSGTGVMLPNIDFGQEVVVKNAGANTLTVYPTTGATIDGAASVTLTTTSKARFVKTSSTIWWTI